jgi:hypothetical protein
MKTSFLVPARIGAVSLVKCKEQFTMAFTSKQPYCSIRKIKTNK